MAYTIKEMSELTGLPASTLRYYDKQGLLPNLRRDQNNIRIFSEEDYRMLRLIDCLKRSGLSIKDIKHFIDLSGQGETALTERLEIFRRRRELLQQEMAELQEVLGIIEYKCWYYEQACEAGNESAVKDSDVPEKFRKARAQLQGHID
ncbi:MAG: MerR family transcriptional regulator [Synergistaceae bacterium]|nr:MerR family transcriptional regulator [Synergistaceae bacterium]